MNIFKQLIVSLYSPKDIATFQHQGIGKTIFYVFLLVVISVLPSVYYFNTSMTSGFETIKETVEKDFPSFTIENGELISDENNVIDLSESLSKASADSQISPMLSLEGNLVDLLKISLK